MAAFLRLSTTRRSGDIPVFESGAVLLYLAEKFGGLLPTDPAARIEAIAWTYFQTGGIGPNMGQAGYLKRQEDVAGFERFNKESHRLVGVMEGVLSGADYLAGDMFSIADIMNFGWLDRAPSYMDFDLDALSGRQGVADPHSARDDVQRGLAVFELMGLRTDKVQAYFDRCQRGLPNS